MTINKSLEFENKHTIADDIDRLITKYKDKIIIFSYRNNGIPSVNELKKIFEKHGKICKEYILDNHTYALNRSNKELHELLYVLT